MPRVRLRGVLRKNPPLFEAGELAQMRILRMEAKIYNP